MRKYKKLRVWEIKATCEHGASVSRRFTNTRLFRAHLAKWEMWQIIGELHGAEREVVARRLQ